VVTMTFLVIGLDTLGNEVGRVMVDADNTTEATIWGGRRLHATCAPYTVRVHRMGNRESLPCDHSRGLPCPRHTLEGIA